MSKTKKTSRASTAKLLPGEHTIDRSAIRPQSDGSLWMDFTILLPSGQKHRPRIKGPTQGIVKRRAKMKADQLLKTNGATTWKTTDSLLRFIEEESQPMMAKAKLSRRTRERYEPVLQLLLGRCTRHRHRHGLKAHTIGSGIRPKTLKAVLDEIARLHSLETARQSRTVLNRFIINALIEEELVERNPIESLPMSQITDVEPEERSRGGKSLTRSQYTRVLEHILAIDPAEMFQTPKQGQRKKAMTAKRRNAIDQMLLQMATGLRSDEANNIDWSLIDIDEDGQMSIQVTKDVAKGGIPRVSLVLEPRVAERMKQRRNAAGGRGYVIGSPTNNAKVWDSGNRNKAAVDLYIEVANALDIPLMLDERSHMWRTTLRSFYAGAVPNAVLNSQFGHGEKTAQKHYTDAGQMEALAKADPPSA